MVKLYQVVSFSVFCYSSLKLIANFKSQIMHFWLDQSVGLSLINFCIFSSSSLLNLDLNTSLSHSTNTSMVNLSSVENISKSNVDFVLLRTFVAESFNCLKVTLSKYFTCSKKMI